MKFFVLLFSLLLVLACGFSLVRFFTNSFRSLRPAWNNQKQMILNQSGSSDISACTVDNAWTVHSIFKLVFFLILSETHKWPGRKLPRVKRTVLLPLLLPDVFLYLLSVSCAIFQCPLRSAALLCEIKTKS